MAPHTEPRDDELHRVMKAALVLKRKAQSDLWMHQRLLGEVKKTKAEML